MIEILGFAVMCALLIVVYWLGYVHGQVAAQIEQIDTEMKSIQDALDEIIPNRREP